MTEKLVNRLHEKYPMKNMELCKSIVLSIADQEPLDFATLNFTNKKVRDNYRKAENMAKEFFVKHAMEKIES